MNHGRPRRPHPSMTPIRFAALLLLSVSILLLLGSAVEGASPNGRPKSLAFSRRGLENANRLSHVHVQRAEAAHQSQSAQDALDDYILSDLIIVSSVEGGIYGLERESGKQVWALPPRASAPQNATVGQTDHRRSASSASGFGPLVGTSYGPKRRSFADMAADVPLIDSPPSTWDGETPFDGASGKEALDTLQDLGLYIVEPSNGYVYVLTSLPTDEASPTSSTKRSTLSKLPLTLPQLVELSPFSFPGDASRVFVGHKRTSLVEIDVRTGDIGAVFGGGGEGKEGIWCHDDADTAAENCTQDPQREWAYMGRTDYELSIHLRGRPALSQTLHFSTFNPNAADREVAQLWLQRGSSPDQRTIMGMPEEGTLLCFNASMSATSPREQQERTLWLREMGATVGGIFDVVYPGALIEEGKFQPVILPHPRGSLASLFGQLPSSFTNRKGVGPSDSVQDIQSTYLGVADGQLYAMASEQYPLVAFTPRAPAGAHADDSADDTFSDHHSRGATSCASYGCLLGSYDVGRSSDRLLGLGPGQAPLLGIGDGSEQQGSGKSDRASGNHSSDDQHGEGDSDAQTAFKQKLSSWMTPTMIMYQLMTLFLFACLCGMIFIGAQELRKQRAEEARAAARQVVWAPLDASASAASNDDSGSSVKTTKNTTSSEKNDVPPAEQPQPPVPSQEQIIKELLDDRPEKKKTAKRRRRGKRAGAAVAAREGKRENSKDDAEAVDGGEESEDEGGQEDADKTTMVEEVNGNATSTVAQPETPSAAAQEALIKIAAKTSLSAEGGSEIALQNGETASARGTDRSLIISEEILGYGSSGTVVFKGTFQGRSVAVKRLLRDFVDVAAKEVSLLESADNHANVIRYFYKEVTDSFLFIALELCPCSLSDIIERPREFQELSALLKPKRALLQIASGLQHLHSLSIVHRDIKPQNILVSQTSNGQVKMLLSDFGLSKRLDGAAQTSFSQTVNNPGGTFGWRAPEILRGEVLLELNGDGETGPSSTVSSVQSGRTSSTALGTNGTGGPEDRKRLTRAVDIFALGCVMYYILSNGDHPFGSRFEREMNILKCQIDLSRLDGLGEEGHEAQHLIMRMVDNEAKERPQALEILSHPYFWDAGRRLAFLQDSSDRFDCMERDPPAEPLVLLEENASAVIGQDWHRKLDRQVMEDLNKRRRYDPKSVAALLRAIRNKKHHIHDVPPNVQRLFMAAGGVRSSLGGSGGSGADPSANHSVQLVPDGFLAYFTLRFPRLFLHTYECINSFEMLKGESSFAAYFRPSTDALS